MPIFELSAALSAFELESASRLMILDASILQDAHVPPFPPDAPALLLGVDHVEMNALKRVLSFSYPQDFVLKVMDEQGRIQQVLLSDIGEISGRALLVPALGTGTSFEAFQEIIAHLRAPED